jgi:hypothetical protein
MIAKNPNPFRLCQGAGRPGLLSLFFIVLTLWPAAKAEAQSTAGWGGPVTILAAGDIGNCKKDIIKRIKNWWRGEDRFYGGHRTAKLLERHRGTILVLGDLVYRYGRELDVNKCFHPTWGAFKHRMAPSPGNHDFDNGTGLPNGWGYYGYWGTKAGLPGQGYYSFQRGAWHIVSLNSHLRGAALWAQEAWLKADLARVRKRCILAFWHHPVFSSGHHGDSEKMAAAYKILYDAGVSVLLTAHEHNYERFAPLAPDGSPDPRGIRSFIVGTGGQKLRKDYTPRPGSVVFDNTSWGVLKMELNAESYAWRFVPVDGHKFTDSGTGRCVKRAVHRGPSYRAQVAE